MSIQSIYPLDYDFSDETLEPKPDLVSEPATGLGDQVFLGLCASEKKERIYGTFYSRDGEEAGGIAYWNKDLEHQETVIFANNTQAADCIVDDDADVVYITISNEGEILACDLDLDDCGSWIGAHALL